MEPTPYSLHPHLEAVECLNRPVDEVEVDKRHSLSTLLDTIGTRWPSYEEQRQTQQGEAPRRTPCVAATLYQPLIRLGSRCRLPKTRHTTLSRSPSRMGMLGLQV
jgi:hypothetical protein